MNLPYVGTLQFYRRMLKTMMKVFDGDADMFHRVRLEVRQKIYEYKDEKEVTQIQNRIFFGEEARDFLTNNILKGKLQQNGRYRFKAQAQNAMNDPIKE